MKASPKVNPPVNDTSIEALWQEALRTENGVAIETSNPDILKRRLYVVRAAARKRGVNDYDLIEVRTSPTSPNSELWLVRSNEKQT